MPRARSRFRGGYVVGPALWLVRLRVRVAMEVVFLLVQVPIRPDDLSNMPSFCAFEVFHAPQSVCAKDDAPLNMMFMTVTPDTSHLEMSPLNDDAEANMPNMLVTLDTPHLEMSPVNDDAENICSMVNPLDTSHLEMSPLNDDAEKNI